MKMMENDRHLPLLPLAACLPWTWSQLLSALTFCTCAVRELKLPAETQREQDLRNFETNHTRLQSLESSIAMFDQLNIR